MRLTLDPTPDTETEPEPEPRAEPRAEPLHPGLGLWGPHYFALWLNVTLLAALVLMARPPRTLYVHPYLQWGIWAAVFGLMAALACQSRVALYDLLIGLNERDRFLLALFTLVPVILPATVRGIRIIPDGLLWAAPLMLLLAVNPWMARRFLALSLLAAWLASMQLHDAVALGMVLAFGFSWLVALGTTHFAYTGDPHGLSGVWPVRRVLLNALLTALPASVAAGLAWWAWPKPAPTPHPITSFARPEPPRPISRLDPMEMIHLIYWGVAMIVVTMLVILLLIYLRRFFLRRSSGATTMKLLPGQVTQLEFVAELPEEVPKGLIGLRGRIVQLWARWAAAVGQAGRTRQPGETAAAYARRLHEEAPGFTPPPAMTALLERAHYAKEEPGKADAEAMERLVKEQLAGMKRTAGEHKPARRREEK